MPFKTRQKKESAASRRYAYIEAVSSVSYNSSKKALVRDQIDHKDKKSGQSVEHEDFFFVRRDLIKIVLVSAAIILIQAVIKFAQNSGSIHF